MNGHQHRRQGLRGYIGRRVVGIGAALASLLVAPAAPAQDYPTRAVKIVVPFPAGGTADAMPRLIGERLSQKWGQPVVIENRTGAGGNIGPDLQVRARRLHAPLGTAAAAGHQPEPLSPARLRPARLRAGHHHEPGAEFAGGQSQDRRQDGA